MLIFADSLALLKLQVLQHLHFQVLVVGDLILFPHGLDHRVVSVLDGMLRPLAHEFPRQKCPSAPVEVDQLEDLNIFLERPFPFLDGRIDAVDPLFPAMVWRPVVLLI